jgi:hypothetical protein
MKIKLSNKNIFYIITILLFLKNINSIDEENKNNEIINKINNNHINNYNLTSTSLINNINNSNILIDNKYNYNKYFSSDIKLIKINLTKTKIYYISFFIQKQKQDKSYNYHLKNNYKDSLFTIKPIILKFDPIKFDYNRQLYLAKIHSNDFVKIY